MSISGTAASVNGTISGSPPPRGLISMRSPAPKLMDRRHGAERRAVRRHRGKPDQVGVVERLVVLDRRQPVARHVELDVGQLLRRVAVGDAGEPRDEVILRRPQRLDLEAPRAVLAFQRAVGRDRHRVLR